MNFLVSTFKEINESDQTCKGHWFIQLQVPVYGRQCHDLLLRTAGPEENIGFNLKWVPKIILVTILCCFCCCCCCCFWVLVLVIVLPVVKLPRRHCQRQFFFPRILEIAELQPDSVIGRYSVRACPHSSIATESRMYC